jgi:hypothetical protein
MRAALPSMLAAVFLAAAPPCVLAASAPGQAGLLDPTQPTPGSTPAPGAREPGTAAAGAVPGAEGSAPARRLEMILLQGERRTAMFDGRLVHVGDTIDTDGGPARVERINEGSMNVLRGDARVVLNLLDETAAIHRRPGSTGAAACTDKLTGSDGCRTP